MTGYLSQEYARSLREFGEPRLLTHSGGWVLHRAIPGTEHRDAMGCYPLFCCKDWSRVTADVREADEDLVSLAIVTDPFGDCDEESLRATFGLVKPFKEHFTVELGEQPDRFVSKHHRYYTRKSQAQVTVERVTEPIEFTDEWTELYQVLADRHGLTGMKAFSREAFFDQLSTPGVVALAAKHQNRTVAAHLWYVQGNVAYSHLAASNARGYELMAAYALYWYAIETFTNEAGVRWMDVGAGAGLDSGRQGGLTQFKRGWANGSRPNYFCGAVFDPEAYRYLVEARGGNETGFFPAYRAGEIG